MTYEIHLRYTFEFSIWKERVFQGQEKPKK